MTRFDTLGSSRRAALSWLLIACATCGCGSGNDSNPTDSGGTGAAGGASGGTTATGGTGGTSGASGGVGGLAGSGGSMGGTAGSSSGGAAGSSSGGAAGSASGGAAGSASGGAAGSASGGAAGSGGSTGGTGGSTGGTGGSTGGTGGTGGSCSAGAACTVPGSPCVTGTISCNTGTPSCDQAGYANAGTTCGTNQVCDGQGSCVSCAAGSACAPPQPSCKTGVVACDTGAPVCKETTTNAANGTVCDTDKVCKAGSCVACVAGDACTTGDPCKDAAISCQTGDPVCAVTGNKTAGTSCGLSKVCNASGACVDCNEGAICTLSAPNQCLVGAVSCQTGSPVCTPTSTTLPNGTPCGTNQVCTGGSCSSCTAGGSCTAPDPCALGTYSCAWGAPPVCVNGAPDPSKAGQKCGASQSGTCTSGKCTCPSGQDYYLGDCQACPVFPSDDVYVDADPAAGVDNLCCGRSQSSGFGGPCRTLTQALKNVQGTNWTVHVDGDAQGNASPDEVYPIRLGNGVRVTSGSGVSPHFPGQSGKAVFLVDVDTTLVQIGYVTIGVTASGTSAGASEGVALVHTSTNGATQLTLTYSTIRGVTTGVRVDGGSLTFGGNTIGDVTTGVSCKSTAAPLSAIGGSFDIESSKQYGLFAGTGCTASSQAFLSLNVGVTGSGTCPGGKKNKVGLHAESSANLLIGADIECVTGNGIELVSTSGGTNNPQVEVQGGIIARAGCAGAYAETGKLRSYGVKYYNDHWGVIQRSNQSSADPNAAIVNLDGFYQNSTWRNDFACIGKAEPGDCCVGGSCPNGFAVWNNSGLPLDADRNYWKDSPVSKCTCNGQLQSCTCAGWPVGQATPPDGVMIVDAPLSAGTPSTSASLPAVSNWTCVP